MHIVLGGTGQVGSLVARALLDADQEVTVVTRDEDRASCLKEAGARVAVADLRDVDSLRQIFRSSSRAFLLNPPADPSTDIDVEDSENVSAMITALEGSGLKKVVAQSTYGALEDERCADLTALHELERGLQDQGIPIAVNRGGYDMSNWASMVEPSRENGKLLSFFPADLALPMVAPCDLGQAAAQRMMEPVSDMGIRYVEGPERYTSQDVADEFALAIGRDVEVQEVPRGALEEAFRQFGFSEKAAASYACMIGKLIDGQTEAEGESTRGQTSLRDYVRSLLSIG